MKAIPARGRFNLMQHLAVVLWSADALLLVLFLIGWCGRYVHPSRAFWIQPVAAALPMLAVLMVAATLGVWLTQRKGPLALHAAVCVLVLVRFAPTERVKRAPALQDPLVLVSFNAKVGAARAANERGLVDLARRSGADVIALQETSVWLTQNPRYYGVHPPLRQLVREGGYEIWKPVGVTDSLFSVAMPLLGRRHIPAALTFVDTTVADEARPFVTRARFTWQGTDVALYNVHLHSFTRPVERRPAAWWLNPAAWRRLLARLREDYMKRAGQAEAIRNRLAGERQPFIVCGDFNSTPHNWAYYHIAKGYQDAFSIAGEGWGGTYHAGFPAVRIDYVVVSEHWKISSSRVLRRLYSDHLPLAAELYLPAGFKKGR